MSASKKRYRGGNRFYQAYQLYPLLGLGNACKLPDEGFPETQVEYRGELYTIYAKPKPAGRWGHRIMLVCSCGMHVPFGRLSQHKWGKSHPA